MDILGGLIGLIIMFAVIACPIVFEIGFRVEYKKKALSYGWAAIQFIVLIIAVLFSNPDYMLLLIVGMGLSIIVNIIAARKTYYRIKAVGVSRRLCLFAAAAQFTAPYAVFLLLILIYYVRGQERNKKKRK